MICIFLLVFFCGKVIEMLPLLLDHVQKEGYAVEVCLLVSICYALVDHSKKRNEYILSFYFLQLSKIKLCNSSIQVNQCLCPKLGYLGVQHQHHSLTQQLLQDGRVFDISLGKLAYLLIIIERPLFRFRVVWHIDRFQLALNPTWNPYIVYLLISVILCTSFFTKVA